MLWLYLLALPVIYTLNSITSLLHNRSLARKTNLPYIIWPFFEANLFYLALWGTRWFPYIVNQWLPESIADHVNDSVFRARWDVKDRMAKRYGGVYLYVTPGGISYNIADADVVSQICKARQNFVKPVKHLEAFDMYGSSIFTTEGSQWTQHHRATAPAFNDKNNALVWTESIRQAREMTCYWSEKYSNDERYGSSFALPDAREDILKLSVNVICSAGFGVKLPFKPAPEGRADVAEDLFMDAVTPASGYRFTFRSVMEYMNRSMMTVFIANGVLPKWIPHSVLPFFKKDYDAHRDLGSYLQTLVKKAEINDNETHNLLERVVHSRREEQNSSNKRNPGLSDAEILGNVYIFSIAGHETTATTLRFALALLAIHGDVQEELHQELRSVLDSEPADPAEWNYATVYLRLISPLCIMLETLRLYSPVVSIPKLTASSGADLTYNEQTHHLPPNVRVNLNGSALHQTERYWGPEANIFDPRRWDKRNSDSFLAQNDGVEGLSGPGLESHEIHRPVRGAYIPFSDGIRACMGKKFAQVEFVAVLAFIFRQYRVTPGKQQGESDEDARKRVERALRGSSTSLTLATMDEVPLTFHRRGCCLSVLGC
ncbi:cytochrome P450 [Aspergillus undulatus]|uniref:cytochrome P450 n=1 Tax=Aspergillus undulatus TaxID=1810928 RepID=UPI003CCD79CB